MFVMDLNPDGVSLDSEILTVGHKVKVIKGELSGIEGEVAIEANKTYVVIRIKDLLTASVKVPKSYLKIIGCEAPNVHGNRSIVANSNPSHHRMECCRVPTHRKSSSSESPCGSNGSSSTF